MTDETKEPGMGEEEDQSSKQEAEERVNGLLNDALKGLPELTPEAEDSLQSPIPMVSSETMQDLVHELATPDGERKLMMQMGEEQPFLIAYLAQFSQILGLSNREQSSIRSAITAMYSAIRRETEKIKK